MAESELDRATEWLERLTHDQSQRGTVTVRSVNEVATKPRYQTCRIVGLIQASGFEPVEHELEYTLRREYWPEVGEVLPANVHVERPERTEIIWELVPKR